jgi:hypothetical protein
MKAWHFVSDKLRDGRPIPEDGEWLKHEGELVLCESGLHASRRLIDALQYAPGNTICRVEVGGEIIEGDDKLVAEKRKILWRVDGEAVLKAFARWCALQVVHLWGVSDVVIEFLKTGDENLRYAAGDAAWSTARYAAGDAAGEAARSAARYAARYAAWSAAREAARSAAWSAAWDAQSTQLELMVEEARNGKTEWVFEMPERSE